MTRGHGKQINRKNKYIFQKRQDRLAQFSLKFTYIWSNQLRATLLFSNCHFQFIDFRKTVHIHVQQFEFRFPYCFYRLKCVMVYFQVLLIFWKDTSFLCVCAYEPKDFTEEERENKVLRSKKPVSTCPTTSPWYSMRRLLSVKQHTSQNPQGSQL